MATLSKDIPLSTVSTMLMLSVGLLWALSALLYNSKIICVCIFLVYLTLNVSKRLLQFLIAVSFFSMKWRPCVILPREQKKNGWHRVGVPRRTVQDRKVKPAQPGLHCQETWSQNAAPTRLPLGFISEGVNCGAPAQNQ